MKTISLSLLLAVAITPAFAQKFMTRTARVSFSATVPSSPEKIDAINNETACVLDGQTGGMQFIVPIKSFKFERELMQEHFNENYMESDKFPKADFKGKVVNMPAVASAKDGSYPVQVAGKLTIHGVTKDVNIPGTVSIKSGVPTANATFSVKLAEYGVAIPSVVADKVAKEARVTVNAPMAAAGH